ncbi:hypothetical protein [Aliikangiella sp. IMCC44359]|uniref:hypothetical protein n=1 Tax=Aliikangiella sp. IMCC44359 TaxID=3459125 RepID=UPI00403B0AAE
MLLPPNNPLNQKQTKQLFKETRNLLGLSGELLGIYLPHFKNTQQQYQLFSLCCNFFQMEKRFNLQLNQMGIDILNYQYNTDMLFNTPLIQYDFIDYVNQFLEAVQSGKQPLIIRSPNRGRY